VGEAGLKNVRTLCLGTQGEAGISFERAFHALAPRPDRPPALLRARLLSAISAVVCAAVDKGYAAGDAEAPERFQARIIATIQRHLQETAGKGASLDSLCRAAGYSKFHFLRLFQRHTGETVKQYINGCRLRKVRELRAARRPQKEIAAALFISESTVKTHIANIFQKLDVNDRTEAVTTALQKGIIKLQ